MNGYQRTWDVHGYAARRCRVLACQASEARKLAALNRIWARMVEIHER